MLKLGSTGPEVIALQKALNAVGFALAEDGDFGAITDATVKTFQSAHGLVQDGVAGPLTLAALGITAPSPAPTAASSAANMIYGVDVSRYQDGMNWAALKTADKQFAVVKASDGLQHTDPDYAAFRKVSRAMGMVTGSYHFFRMDFDPVAQAEHFLKVTGGLPSGEFLAIDSEWDNLSSDYGYRDSEHGGTRGSMDAKGYKALLACARHVEDETGVPPVIYTGASWFDSKDAAPVAFSHYPLWVFAYTSNFAHVHIPKPWTKAAFWQNSGGLSVPGSNVSGIDGDIFFGGIDDLKALCKA